MFLASPRKGCLMSSKALLILRELLINRRREIFEQVAHLEPVNGHTMINSILYFN